MPESPIWLISKGRHSVAEKALRWQRGWTTAANVELELLDLHRHSKTSQSCRDCRKKPIECSHTSSMMDKVIGAFDYGNCVPFLLYTLAVVLNNVSKTVTKRFPSTIFSLLNAGDNGYYDLTSVYSIATNLICVILIRYVGKRKVYLHSLFGGVVLAISIGNLSFQIFFSRKIFRFFFYFNSVFRYCMAIRFCVSSKQRKWKYIYVFSAIPTAIEFCNVWCVCHAHCIDFGNVCIQVNLRIIYTR